MLIILAAVFLNFVLGFIGVTQALTTYIKELGLSPMQTMLIIIVFYLILGMFMETFSMMLTTVPLIFPIIEALGFDGVWFGILVTVLMETALITPPIGGQSLCGAGNPPRRRQFQRRQHRRRALRHLDARDGRFASLFPESRFVAAGHILLGRRRRRISCCPPGSIGDGGVP